MVKINLLPWRDELRAVRKRQFYFILIGAAIISLLMMLFLHSYFERQIDRQQRRNEFINQHISKLNLQIEEIKTLEEKRDALRARIDVIETLQENRILIVHLFDELSRIVPEGVFMTKIQRQGPSLTIQGKAESNIRISTFLRKIEQSEWFTTPVLTGIQAENEPMLEFSLKVNHKPIRAPLSGESNTDESNV